MNQLQTIGRDGVLVKEDLLKPENKKAILWKWEIVVKICVTNAKFPGDKAREKLVPKLYLTKS
jgi:hypothetical protein